MSDPLNELHQPDRVTTNVLWEIGAERNRQMTSEGWTPEHDDQHSNGSIANAAACYASSVRAFQAVQFIGRGGEVGITYRDLWPWQDKWWKPKDRRRDLLRAGALIVAEIERLDRATAKRTRNDRP